MNPPSEQYMLPRTLNIIWHELVGMKYDLAIVKVFALISYFGGVITDVELLKMIGASFAGAILAGYGFALIAPTKNLPTVKARWATNVCLGVPLGLAASFQFRHFVPELPDTIAAALFSALAGPVAVMIIPIGIPFLVEIVKLGMAAKKEQVRTIVRGAKKNRDIRGDETQRIE